MHNKLTNLKKFLQQKNLKKEAKLVSKLASKLSEQLQQLELPFSDSSLASKAIEPLIDTGRKILEAKERRKQLEIQIKESRRYDPQWASELEQELEELDKEIRLLEKQSSQNSSFLKKMSQEKKKIYVLVGPPSVGKSTWIKNKFVEEPYIINRDQIVEDVAKEYGWTYDDMFMAPPTGSKIGDEDPIYGTVIPSPKWMGWQPKSWSKVLEANDKVKILMDQRIAGAVPSNKNIVVDMTNLTPSARASALSAIKGFESDYIKVAVVFDFAGAEDDIIEVAKQRAEQAKQSGGAKTIPEHVHRKMFESFKAPHESEGFHELEQVDNRKLMKDLAGRANR